MADKVCFNINFDSLGWAFSEDPEKFNDPTFFHVADRFFKASDRYGFKYTIFIIGRDLENPKVAERVREWSAQGHEIGNHSYSHRQNLGYLRGAELEREVMKSHELIAKVCGTEPKGFIAPAWAASVELLDILIKNGYLYDTSIFPSYFMWPILAKLRWNFRNDERRSTVFERRDGMANLFARREPYFSKGGSLLRRDSSGILIFPLPSSPILRIPCWHTISFIMPRFLFRSVLNSCMREKYFYYLMHPADLLDINDVPEGKRHIRNLERISIPLERKMANFTDALDIILKRSPKIVTLEEMAREIISNS